jgi:fibronectin-binding autotransporter adhesin
MADRNRRFAAAAVVLPLLFLVMSGLARATTFTVINRNDTGAGSLRAAITSANSMPTVANNINFIVSGTITLGSTLPAIANTSPGSLTIDGSGQSITIDGAHSFQIFRVNSGATLKLQVMTLENGSVTGGFPSQGGAILNNGMVTVTDCTFLDNQVTGLAGGIIAGFANGGAIANNGTLTVNNSTFSDNQATGGAGIGIGSIGGSGQGGAIFNNGTLTVNDSTFSDNQATGGASTTGSVLGGFGVGGAINSDSPLTVTNSTFSANRATGGGGSRAGSGDGGAISSESTGTTVTNCTFADNQASGGIGSIFSGSGKGGAIINLSGGSGAILTITNSTFSGNKAEVGSPSAGAIGNSNGTVNLKGTILAGSSPNNCGGSSITSASYSIADDSSCFTNGTNNNVVVASTSAVGLDPAGLAMNGGPTETIALEPDSEAVDFIPVANCTDQSMPTPQPLTTDQRGFPRPDFGNPRFCDAGAFELTTTPFVVEANGERLQIARSTAPNSDKVNMAFTFIENASPTCDAADDAFNGVTVLLESGSCASFDHASLELMLEPWVVHTVNHQSYGTIFISNPPETISARMVQLPTPAPPACGEWTVNIEVAGIDSTPLGNGPFALILSNADGDQGCFDITNAIVGSQTPPPPHGVRRRVRR